MKKNPALGNVRSLLLYSVLMALLTVILLNFSVIIFPWLLTIVTILGKVFVIVAVIIGGVFFPIVIGFMIYQILSFIVVNFASSLKENTLRLIFLPEDCIGNLIALKARMKKQKIPLSQIYLRLLEEVLSLLLVFYIRIPLENLILSINDYSNRQVDE